MPTVKFATDGAGTAGGAPVVTLALAAGTYLLQANLTATAVDEHHRVPMPYLRRGPVLDVHLLAVDNGAAREMRLLHADPEVAPLGEIDSTIG